MNPDESKSELKEYAGGWITELKGTVIPGFLKLAYPVIAIAMLTYLFIFMNGEVNHSTRGELVKQLNAVTGTAPVMMFVVAALIAIYLVILVTYVLRKPEHEE